MNLCEKILLYAQNELSGNEQSEMQEHLKTCVACQQELSFLHRLDQAMNAPAAPEKMIDALFAKTTRKKSFFTTWKKVLATGMAALLVGVVVWVNKSSLDVQPFNAQELVAYMNVNLEEDYQWLDDDLTAMEEDF